MAGIRTVLGDIPPEELGVCDFHDHLIRSSGPELTDWVKAGFQFLLPFYQLFEQAYGMAE